MSRFETRGRGVGVTVPRNVRRAGIVAGAVIAIGVVLPLAAWSAFRFQLTEDLSWLREACAADVRSRAVRRLGREEVIRLVGFNSMLGLPRHVLEQTDDAIQVTDPLTGKTSGFRRATSALECEPLLKSSGALARIGQQCYSVEPVQTPSKLVVSSRREHGRLSWVSNFSRIELTLTDGGSMVDRRVAYGINPGFLGLLENAFQPRRCGDDGTEFEWIDELMAITR